MREHGPPAKYLILPPNIDINDIVMVASSRVVYGSDLISGTGVS
jgi:hypothetical protein